MVDRKQILDVLHYIKKECEKQDNCDECVFCDTDGLCRLQKPAQEWELKESEQEEKWTPFKN